MNEIERGTENFQAKPEIRTEVKNQPEQTAESLKPDQKREEDARAIIDKEALTFDEQPAKQEKSHPDHTRHITKSDKQHAYRVTLSHIQGQLPGMSKSFSRIIHNKRVETGSAFLEKTVARPSGLLGAALSATVFLGIMFFFARRNGFALSGSELPIALVVGWIVGVSIEMIKKFIWRRPV